MQAEADANQKEIDEKMVKVKELEDQLETYKADYGKLVAAVEQLKKEMEQVRRTQGETREI